MCVFWGVAPRLTQGTPLDGAAARTTTSACLQLRHSGVLTISVGHTFPSVAHDRPRLRCGRGGPRRFGWAAVESRSVALYQTKESWVRYPRLPARIPYVQRVDASPTELFRRPFARLRDRPAPGSAEKRNCQSTQRPQDMKLGDSANSHLSELRHFGDVPGSGEFPRIQKLRSFGGRGGHSEIRLGAPCRQDHHETPFRSDAGLGCPFSCHCPKGPRLQTLGPAMRPPLHAECLGRVGSRSFDRRSIQGGVARQRPASLCVCPRVWERCFLDRWLPTPQERTGSSRVSSANCA